MLTIEILDGSPVYVEGLRAVLGANGLTVTARSSVDVGPPWRADLFLIDPSLVADAFIAGASRVAPVMVLTTWHDDQAIAAYAELGARGLVDRRATATTVLTAIQIVVDGGQSWGAIPSPGPARTRPTNPDPLSPRERQVLHQIGRGLTHTQVATRLGISKHTVDTYVKRVRTKLNLGNKAELTHASVLTSGSR